MGKDFIHPYMPNSVPGIKEEMLQELGIKSVEEIYGSCATRNGWISRNQS